MRADKSEILGILDNACRAFTFPMLDNGYVYLAATRLSLYRSEADWALVIEVFGYSPRSGLPDTQIYTFGSRLHNRDTPAQYASEEAYSNYLRNNPHNDSRFVFPIAEGNWIDPEESEMAVITGTVRLRGKNIPLPVREDYLGANIMLNRERPAVFELCRYLAQGWRDDVLATPSEQRVSILPEMTKLLELEDWHHPNVVIEELPSQTETFSQLAEVLASGDTSCYRTNEPANTHWWNWPEGGSL